MNEATFTNGSVAPASPGGAASSGPGAEPQSPEGPRWLAAAPVLFAVALLLFATLFHGAFAVRYWTPPALFGLVVLAALVGAGGGAPLHSRWLRAMLAGIWGLALWALLSALWSPAPSEAWEQGARDLLYAAVVTLPVIGAPRTQVLRLGGMALIAGVALLAAITLGQLLVAGPSHFLAGRLEGFIGYRNATALLFCLGVWPLLGLMASRNVPQLLRAVAFSAAALEVGLAFLTQSRGMVLGLGAGAVVSLALGPDRVRRAWVTLLLVVLVAAFSGMLLRAYDAFDGGHGIVTSESISTATYGVVALTIVAFVVGFVIAVFDAGMRGTSLRSARLAARWALGIVVVLALVGGVAKFGSPVTRIQHAWTQFHDVDAAATGSTRLTFAGGQRSDLWQVALDELSAHPLAGAGAGGYPFDYYVHRHTDRNLSDPHGLPFQVLGELGLIGMGLLLLFVVGAGGAIVRGWSRTPPDLKLWASGLAASGAVLLGQLAVDWMWLIPGLTSIGLFCLATAAAIVTRAAADEPEGETVRRRLPMGWRVALAGGLAAAAVCVLLLFLADYWVRESRNDAGRSNAGQLSAARMAADFSPYAVTPLYLQASALESMGRRDAARGRLEAALRLEPGNAVTLGLLGDLEVRAGHLHAARAFYRRALALDPLDVGLQQLASGHAATPGA